MGWGFIYSATAYKPPEEKKVILGVYSYGSSANAAAYMALDAAAPDVTGELEAAGITDVSDIYIFVFHETGNDENVLKFLSIMVHDLLTASFQ